MVVSRHHLYVTLLLFPSKYVLAYVHYKDIEVLNANGNTGMHIFLVYLKL